MTGLPLSRGVDALPLPIHNPAIDPRLTLFMRTWPEQYRIVGLVSLESNMAGNILRPKRAQKKLDVGHSMFYELAKRPDFPRSISLGARARGYFEHELDAWLESRRDSKQRAAA